MPLRELSKFIQIVDSLKIVDPLKDWGDQLKEPAEMILTGSGGLLWHAHQAGHSTPLSENSMAADPITSSDAVAELAYNSITGSDFEKKMAGM